LVAEPKRYFRNHLFCLDILRCQHYHKPLLRLMIQKEFAERAAAILKDDEDVLGLAVAGSWLTNELDEFSDLDLVLITKEKITHDKNRMTVYAKLLGELLSGFTGEHVGEARVLICLYANPLLHVDIKFLTLQELHPRIETPILLLDKKGELKRMLTQTEPEFPYSEHQWIEDRFWIWIHYALLKVERGELLEAFDFFGFLRMVVLGPLLHIRNGNLPRGVRKVETQLPSKDFKLLRATIPVYSKSSLLNSLDNAVTLYRQLRNELFGPNVVYQTSTEEEVMKYFSEAKQRVSEFETR
jgi:hypothetical protein